MTFSITVMFRKSRSVWNVRAMPLFVILCGARPEILSPSKTISPESTWKIPVIRLKTVVLPAPFGPITLTISPSSTCRSSSLTTLSPPKAIDTFCSSSSFSGTR